MNDTAEMKWVPAVRTACAARLLVALALLALPAAAQAQFAYTTYGGKATITGYTGPGGAVFIPSIIGISTWSPNGYPVTSIGTNTFQYKSNLTSVTIPDSVTNIGHYAFDSCRGLTNVVIGNGVTTIGYSAFYSCTLLPTITIPNSVTRIWSAAFDSCTNLTSATIGSSITNGAPMFVGCTRLSAITVDALNAAYSSMDGVLFNKTQSRICRYPEGKAGSDYTIPSSVTDISAAFYRCTSLTNVAIPSSVTNIGDFAFDRCTSLPSVTIPNSVTSIGVGAFQGCTNLPSVTIPDSVASIGDSAFRSCTSLTNITIPNSVTSIGSAAFVDCTSLASVTIPNRVTRIEDYTFESCTSLTNVTIGNGVTSIGNGAFSSCSRLVNISIPKSLTSIGSPFSYCTSLKQVRFGGNAPSITPGGGLGFIWNNNATVYYLPGTTGWRATYGGWPTALWRPVAQTSAASFGVRTNQFGFNIAWASGQVIVVEASTDLTNPIWTPLQTNTLTGGASYFSDPDWTNYPGRFYRIRSP